MNVIDCDIDLEMHALLIENAAAFQIKLFLNC